MRTGRREAAEQRQAELDDQLAKLRALLVRVRQAEAGADDELRESRQMWHDFLRKNGITADTPIREELDEAIKLIEERAREAEHRATFGGYAAELAKAVTIGGRINALAAGLRELKMYRNIPGICAIATKVGFDYEERHQLLLELVQVHYRELCELAPNDPEAVPELRTLIRNTKVGGTGEKIGVLRSLGVPELEWPADFNLWVSRHTRAPHISDFAPLPVSMLTIHDLCQRAGELLVRDETDVDDLEIRLRDAKIVIAQIHQTVCSKSPDAVTAAQFIVELSKIVAELEGTSA